jgi:hypothetical protein
VLFTYVHKSTIFLTLDVQLFLCIILAKKANMERADTKNTLSWVKYMLHWTVRDAEVISSSPTIVVSCHSDIMSLVAHNAFLRKIWSIPKFSRYANIILSVSLQFTRSWTISRTPWTGDRLVTRPLPVHKHRKTHIHKH